MKRILALVLVLCGTGIVGAADWMGFRGSKGDGVSPENGLPTELKTENILWKAKLPGLGTSSPVIVGKHIFLTAYSGYGTTISKGMGKGGGGFGKGGFGKGGKGDDSGGDQKKLKLLVLCLDQVKGDIVWQKEITPKLPEMTWSGFMREHGYASHTPVSDGQALYVFFGKSGVYAFDLQGKELWRANVGSGVDKWGSAASPVLYKDLVIVNAAIESDAVVALDKTSGKEVWRIKNIATNWATPLLVETKEGKQELVMSLPGKISGYDPEKGELLWHCEGIGSAGGKGYTSSSPVAKDGIVYVIGGGGPTPTAAIAVKSGGRGDVNKSHILWRQRAGTSSASPVLVSDQLCFVAGTATCMSISDGKTKHSERLYDNRGEYVSPVVAGDAVYALTRFNGLFVFSTGEKLRKLSHLEFDGDSSVFNASPAISNGRLYVRSNSYLYCIGKK